MCVSCLPARNRIGKELLSPHKVLSEAERQSVTWWVTENRGRDSPAWTAGWKLWCGDVTYPNFSHPAAPHLVSTVEMVGHSSHPPATGPAFLRGPFPSIAFSGTLNCSVTALGDSHYTKGNGFSHLGCRTARTALSLHVSDLSSIPCTTYGPQSPTKRVKPRAQQGWS